jgi:3-oxoacyl-[acyl-carrier-protein] synthase-3
MGTTIEAVGTSRPQRRFGGTGAIKLADEAARSCLQRAGRTAADLDFLINAGVYRDNNIAEPAVASMIQEDIGANPDPPLQGGHGTFSFDVVNGACGVLTGMHILDGFLTSAAIDLGMVVTADADPERGSNWDFPLGLVGSAGRVSRSGSHARFPFTAAGGAVLLSRSEKEDKGFSRFAFATFPEFAHLLESEVTWEEEGRVRRALAGRVPGLRSGSNVLRIRQGEDYGARCAECAVTSTRTFLQGAGLRASDIDLLVPSPTPASFPDDVGQALGVPADRVARVDKGFERVHTAGPIAAFESAMRSGHFGEARNVLFVTAGAGISVGLALYHP